MRVVRKSSSNEHSWDRKLSVMEEYWLGNPTVITFWLFLNWRLRYYYPLSVMYSLSLNSSLLSLCVSTFPVLVNWTLIVGCLFSCFWILYFLSAFVIAIKTINAITILIAVVEYLKILDNKVLWCFIIFRNEVVIRILGFKC